MFTTYQISPALVPVQCVPAVQGSELLFLPPSEKHLFMEAESLTSRLPWKIMGSAPGPVEKAKVQIASPVLSSYGSTILFRPSRPIASRKYLLENDQLGSLYTNVVNVDQM
jgi:hypothetical protein